MVKKEKHIIGRSDIADFPELGLKDIKVKIDTGAYSSAIHCADIKEKLVDGKVVIKVWLLKKKKKKKGGKKKKQKYPKPLIFEDYRLKHITSSTGNTELRYMINSTIRLFGEDFPIELSLAERKERRYPILIGRKMLKGKFIVDPARYNLSHRQKLKAEKAVIGKTKTTSKKKKK